MEKIDLLKLTRFIFKYILVVIVLTVGGAWLAREYTNKYVTKDYSSAVQVIAPINNKTKSDSDAAGEIDKNIRLITTYADVVRSTTVLKAVAQEINGKTAQNYSVGDLYDAIAVDHNSDSQVFSIKVNATDPQDAALIANTTFNVFKQNVHSLLGVNSIEAISQATVNQTPDSPNTLMNTLIGALAGFMLAIGALVAIDYGQRSRKAKRSVVANLGINELGKVSTIPLRQLHHVRRQLVKTSAATTAQLSKGEKPA